MIRLEVQPLDPPGSPQRHPPRSHHGILRLEVDGIDLGQGRLEGPLVAPLVALLEGLGRIWQGARRSEAIAFEAAGLELLIAGRASTASLSLLASRRPAHLLFQDIEVSLERLLDAALAGAERVHRDLDPGEDTEALRSAIRSLARARRLPPLRSEPEEGSPTFLRSSPVADGLALGFEIQDRKGRLSSYRGDDDLDALLAPGLLYLHLPHEPAPLAVAGIPYLLMRDLVDGALRLLHAARDGLPTFSLLLGHGAPTLHLDLEARSWVVEGSPGTVRSSPEDLAARIFQGAQAFVEALCRSQPQLRRHPLLQSLEEDALIRLALSEERAGGHRPPRRPVEVAAPSGRARPPEAPLAPGSMRRVHLRAGLGRSLPPLERVEQRGPRLWVKHREGLLRLHLDRWEDELALPLPRGAEVAVAGPREPFFTLDEHHLACHGPGGRQRWRRPAGALHALGALHYPLGSDAAFLLVDGASLVVLATRDGEELFRFDPPTARGVRWASHGRLIVLAADSGIVYGVDAATPEVSWRIPLYQPWDRLAMGAGLIWGGSTARGAASLDALDPATGQLRLRVELPLSEIGSLTPLPQGILVAGIGSAGGELLQLDARGAIRWRARPMLGAHAPTVARAGGAIYARGSEGACRIERGKVRWNVPCEPGGPPVVLRGIVALPGESIALLDAASGRSLLDPARILPVAPELFLQTRAGTLVSCEREGSLVRLELAGGLAVLPSLP